MATIEKLFDRRASERRKLAAVDVGAAGWYPDPTERHDLRFFDGKQWTDQRTRILPTEPDRRTAALAQVGS